MNGYPINGRELRVDMSTDASERGGGGGGGGGAPPAQMRQSAPPPMQNAAYMQQGAPQLHQPPAPTQHTIPEDPFANQLPSTPDAAELIMRTVSAMSTSQLYDLLVQLQVRLTNSFLGFFSCSWLAFCWSAAHFRLLTTLFRRLRR